MIFAAGLGTRLKPLTDTVPKALVPVAGKPLLEHIVLKLKAAGFDEIIVNVHHFAEQIIDFFKEKNNFDIRIEISDETDRLLDTGGGIKRAAAFFDDGKPFLLYNVDIISNVDLRRMYDFSLKKNALATLLVSKRHTSRYLLFDKQNRLAGWLNETTKEVKSPYPTLNPNDYSKLAFAGIHVLSPAIFKYMNDWSGKFSIVDFYLSIADTCTIEGYTQTGLQALDVGRNYPVVAADMLSDRSFIQSEQNYVEP